MESTLVRLLQCVQSGEVSTRKPAEAQLESYLEAPGFLPTLIRISSSGGSDWASVRLQAILYVKNALNGLLNREADAERSRDLQTLTLLAVEKEAVQEGLLLLVKQDSVLDELVQTQLAVTIAYLARRSWPRKWAGLMPCLGSAATSQTPVIAKRGLEILVEVLDALSSLRLPSDLVLYCEAAVQLYPPFFMKWTGCVQTCIKVIKSYLVPPSPDLKPLLPDMPSLRALVAQTQLLTRCVYRLVIASMPHFCPLPQLLAAPSVMSPSATVSVASPESATNPPIASLLSAARALFPLHASLPRNPSTAALVAGLAKVLYSIGRCSLICLDEHIDSLLSAGAQNQEQSLFILIFRFHIDVIQHYATRPRIAADSLGSSEGSEDEDGERSHPDLLLVQSLNVCTAVVGCRKRVAMEAVQAVLGQQAACNLARALVMQFLPLSPAELRKWHQEPEAYLEDQFKDRAEDRLRPAAEALFTCLLKQHSTPVAEMLLQLLGQNLHVYPPSAQEPTPGSPQFFAVLQKEAVYCAAGLASYELSSLGDKQALNSTPSAFSFKSWYAAVLRHELHSNQQGMCRELLRCRVVALVEEFCGDVVEDMRGELYRALITIMSNHDRSIVARLACVKSLKEMVDVNFVASKHIFVSCLPQYLAAMWLVLASCQELDTREQILLVMRQAITRVGGDVRGSLGAIKDGLPLAWKQYEEQNVLRLSLLKLLSSVVNALVTDSSSLLLPFVLPILQYCFEPGEQSERGYLLHEGLLLLRSCLRMATAAPPPVILLSLFPLLLHFLQQIREEIDTLLEVIESYCLLFGASVTAFIPQYLARAGPDFSQLLTRLASPLPEASAIRPLSKLTEIVEMVLIAFPGRFNEYAPLVLPLVPSLVTILKRHLNDHGISCASSAGSPPLTSEQRRIQSVSLLVASQCSSLLARLFFQRCDDIVKWFHSSGIVEDILVLVNVWVTWGADKRVHVLSPMQRKMFVLASLQVLTNPLAYSFMESSAASFSHSNLLASSLKKFMIPALESAVGVVKTVQVVDSLGLKGGYLRRARSSGQEELPPEEERRTAVEKADLAGPVLDLAKFAVARGTYYGTQFGVIDVLIPFLEPLRTASVSQGQP